MRFSIITITFNAEKYLAETLSSVANQQFRDFEHIVFDGGSSDQTIAIVQRFPHVKLISGKDSGISDAMNQGAKAAIGDFLLHLHGDDLLAHPRVLSFVDTALKQHPNIDWLHGQVDIIDEQGNKKGSSTYHPFNYKRLKKYNCIPHPATFYRRSFFLEMGGFDTKLKLAMDYDLWLRMGQKKESLAMASVFASFREHENSLSTTLPLEVAKEAFFVRNHYLTNWVEKFKSYRTYRKRVKKYGKTS